MKTSKKKTTKPLGAQLALVRSLLHDPKQTAAGRRELQEWVDEMINDAGVTVDHPAIFPKMFKLAAAKFDASRRKTRAARYVQKILARVSAGESLDAIAQERAESLRAWSEQHRRAQLNAPEPKDRLSDEWRHWKLAQIQRAFCCGELNLYAAAWEYIEQLQEDLRGRGCFGSVDFIMPILPHLIIAHQEIERGDLSPIAGRKRRTSKGGAK